MRKKIVAILLIATMAMGIAACGGSGDKKDDNTITVWCWDKTFNIFAMEEAAKIYQEDHQDVKIDIVEVGDVDVQSRLTTAGTSGDLSTLPDIFLMQDHAFQKNVLSYPDVFTEISEKKIDFSEFASGICKDAGFHSIASQIDIFGKLSILLVSLPVLITLLETVESFLT